VVNGVCGFVGVANVRLDFAAEFHACQAT